ncbi:MAG: GTP cyclohydrolase I FolE [Phycisphaerae bacterium]|nr:GTP cyclohydrolase I FolE [Phycisphaerae bacterium]
MAKRAKTSASSGNAANQKAPAEKKEPIDHDRLVAAAREILLALGEDPKREGLLKTPERVARMYAEVFSGLREDPTRHLKAVFSEDYDEMIALRDIPFYSMCEHHLLPFLGRAHIAYVPDRKIIGISKLARIVECYARRPQVQERLTSQIADLLMTGLRAKGVAVVIEATHTCMTIRGVKKPGSEMVTSAVRGLFKKNAATRNEVLSFLKQSRGD